MIRSLVHNVVFAHHPELTQVFFAPFGAKKGSWSAIANAGFRLIATLEDDAGSCELMAADRRSTS